MEYNSELEMTDAEAKKVEVYFVKVECPEHGQVGVEEIMEGAEGWCHCGKSLKTVGRKRKVKIGK